jgi:hypothetical protein
LTQRFYPGSTGWSLKRSNTCTDFQDDTESGKKWCT